MEYHKKGTTAIISSDFQKLKDAGFPMDKVEVIVPWNTRLTYSIAYYTGPLMGVIVMGFLMGSVMDPLSYGVIGLIFWIVLACFFLPIGGVIGYLVVVLVVSLILGARHEESLKIIGTNQDINLAKKILKN